MVVVDDAHHRLRYLQEVSASWGIVGIGQQHMARVPSVPRTEMRGKGHEHERVLQALGFVHRHHLHEVGIALQTQHLLIASATATLLFRQFFLTIPDEFIRWILRPCICVDATERHSIRRLGVLQKW